jgi:hypothetical protein
VFNFVGYKSDTISYAEDEIILEKEKLLVELESITVFPDSLTIITMVNGKIAYDTNTAILKNDTIPKLDCE